MGRIRRRSVRERNPIIRFGRGSLRERNRIVRFGHGSLRERNRIIGFGHGGLRERNLTVRFGFRSLRERNRIIGFGCGSLREQNLIIGFGHRSLRPRNRISRMVLGFIPFSESEFLPPIQGGPQIDSEKNLWASLNLREITKPYDTRYSPIRGRNVGFFWHFRGRLASNGMRGGCRGS
jgi:hypothetical protein